MIHFIRLEKLEGGSVTLINGRFYTVGPSGQRLLQGLLGAYAERVLRLWSDRRGRWWVWLLGPHQVQVLDYYVDSRFGRFCRTEFEQATGIRLRWWHRLLPLRLSIRDVLNGYDAEIE